jgi:hypothetical protein
LALAVLGRFRAVDAAFFWVPLRLCERVEVDRDFVVRVFADELLRGFDLPPPDLRVLVLVLLVCCATGSSSDGCEPGYLGAAQVVGTCELLPGMLRKAGTPLPSTARPAAALSTRQAGCSDGARRRVPER